MGRVAKGWKLEWRRGGIGYVRFTHAKRQHLISTGQRDPRKAAEEAARLYARVVGGGVARPASTRALVLAPLPNVLAEWLASLLGTLDPETIKTYETTYVGRHWTAHYSSLEEMASEAARERYRTARLQRGTAETVKKECWVQDKFLRWCKRMKLLGSTPPPLEWEKTTLGTRVGRQRKSARQLTEAQVDDSIASMPAWSMPGKRAHKSKRPYPIRARFEVAYETGLRPATLSELVWDDYRGERLVIRSEVDKIRYGREVPLSAAAQLALEALRIEARELGLEVVGQAPIFGRHQYRGRLRSAAAAAGLDGLAPYDLRHARTTHLADAGAPLTGIAHIVGHKQVTTTNKYAHPSLRAAEEALAKDAISGASGSAPSTPPIKGGDRRGLNPRHLEPQGKVFLAGTRTCDPHVAAEDRGKHAGTAGKRVQDLESPEPRSEAFLGPIPADDGAAISGPSADGCTFCRGAGPCESCGTAGAGGRGGIASLTAEAAGEFALRCLAAIHGPVPREAQP